MTELEARVREQEAALASATDPARIADLMAKLGSNLEAVGQRERALELLGGALELFEQLNNAKRAVDVLHRTGGVLMTMNRRDEARSYFERARAAARLQADSSAEATSLNNLAILDEMEGNLERSCEQYEHRSESFERSARPESSRPR